jgi:enoyl-CoA hydratase
MTTVDLTRTDEIVTLTLNNPGKLNAINLVHVAATGRKHGQNRVDRSIRCIVIRGAGQEAFAAGGDLEEFVTGRTPRSIRRCITTARSPGALRRHR